MGTTLQDIAKQANTSLMTASRSLRGTGRVNPETRRRIRAIADRLGYTRHKGLVMQSVAPSSDEARQRLLVPVFGKAADLAKSRTGQALIDGLKDRLEELGGTLEVVEVKDIADLLKACKKRRPHGVVLRRPFPRAWVEKLRETAPVVYAISHDYQEGVDAVYANEHRSGAMIMDRLTSLGHREIAWFGVVDHHAPFQNVFFASDSSTVVDRQAWSIHNIRHAVWAGLAVCQPDQKKMPMVLLERDWRFQSLEDVVARGLSEILTLRPQPTAIVVASDAMAHAMLGALRARGLRVPEDMSLVGYGMAGDEQTDLPLTRIDLPMKTIGRAIPELIRRRLADPDALAMSVQLDTTLFEGATIAPVRRS
ncbi:LacI family DNA-binding transcriptional regulator [Phycisphaerales bacterium AB-hyl4]|uniref:LacI family DNA-binding transcriptional regulator n=1 Tax=Natronomicrosphaera hydrolytica TaxID=3242702 RepID=A0ABV4UAB8_9BACT